MIFCISVISCFESFFRRVNATKNCGSDPLKTASALLREGGMIIAEHAADVELPAAILDALHLSKSRRIGDTALSFYRLAANNHHPEEIAP